MTLEQFVAAIEAAQTYAEAKDIMLSQSAKLIKMSNAERDKWRLAWKKRKAILKPS